MILYIWLGFFAIRLKNNSLPRFHVKCLQEVMTSDRRLIGGPSAAAALRFSGRARAEVR